MIDEVERTTFDPSNPSENGVIKFSTSWSEGASRMLPREIRVASYSHVFSRFVVSLPRLHIPSQDLKNSRHLAMRIFDYSGTSSFEVLSLLRHCCMSPRGIRVAS